MNTTFIDVPPGLKGVAVADTMLGSVRGAEGFYHYRNHDAVELARTQSVTDIWHLLLDGSLPADEIASARFAREVGSGRVVDIDPVIVDAVAAATQAPHLALMSLLPLVAPEGRATTELDDGERRAMASRLAAVVPTLLAATHRRRQGLDVVAPDPDRGHAEDWVRMALGHDVDPDRVAMVEAYLSATIDHGFNASTFATRVVTSTGADVAAAMCAGVGALSGPLHGGAPALALSMIDEIGDPTQTEAWVTARLEAGHKIMGFGHAVYRADDPRSLLLRGVAERHGGELVERAIDIEERILAVMRAWKPDAVIVTNVEFYAGIVLHLAGLTPDLFTSTFTVSRVIGWAAHLVEQAANNKILRPSARYVGPEPTKGAAMVS